MAAEVSSAPPAPVQVEAAETRASVEALPGTMCLPAIAAAEQAEGLPSHILRSIALVESGRVDPFAGRTVPWPWTINAAGTGFYYASKQEAVAAAQAFQARGVRSIDVGCAQVNLQHHPRAFASLDAAFDPETNTLYAARFLNALRRASGSWPLAAAGYHSQTAELGYPYARRVLAIWPGSARYGSLPPLPPGTPSGAARTPRPAAVDYSVYTPEFAARVRRMDEERARAGPVRTIRQVGPGPAPRALRAARQDARGPLG